MKKILFVLFIFIGLTRNVFAQTSTLVKDINPNGSSMSLLSGLNGIQIGNKLLFAASDPINGSELWISDGTAVGTSLVKDIIPGIQSSTPSRFFLFRGFAYFIVSGSELWRSDGTPDGTIKISSDESYFLSSPIIVNNELYFAQSYTGVVLKDPDKPGYKKIIDPTYDSNLYSLSTLPTNFSRFGNKWLYVGISYQNTTPLYVSDGTKEGTKELFDAQRIGNNLVTTQSGKLAFFTNTDSKNARELWVTDGTVAGTKIVKDIVAGNNSSVDISTPIVALQNAVLFVADDNVTGKQLWISDGTESGTKLLKVFTSGRTNPDFKFFSTSNEESIYFSAAGSLWRSDGTESGTYTLSKNSRSFYGLKKVGSLLYYLDSDSQIIRSNGQPNNNEVIGTLSNIYYNYVTGYGSDFIVVGGIIYYMGSTGDTGDELWKLAFCNHNVAITSLSSSAVIISLCNGGSTTVEASTAGGTGAFSYVWKNNNRIVANTKQLVINQPGTYTVDVINQGCTVSTSVEIKETANLPVTVSGTNAVCAGTAAPLSATVSGGVAPYVYQWRQSGSAIGGATTSTFSVTATGVYSVSVADSKGCTGTSSGFTVTVKPSPTPTITTATTSLTSGASTVLTTAAASGQTYQWYRNAQAIAGATNNTYTATADGAYTVLVTRDGCSATSPGITLRVVLATEPTLTSLGLDVFPNPVQQNADVRLSMVKAAPATFTLVDAGGNTVGEWQSTPVRTTHALTLPMKAQPAGIYFLRVEAGGLQAVRRVLKQ